MPSKCPGGWVPGEVLPEEVMLKCLPAMNGNQEGEGVTHRYKALIYEGAQHIWGSDEKMEKWLQPGYL